VYCDILEHVQVGDGLAPLLRSVVVRGKHGDQIGERFVNPMYLPIQKKSFDRIEINTRSPAVAGMADSWPHINIIDFHNRDLEMTP